MKGKLKDLEEHHRTFSTGMGQNLRLDRLVIFILGVASTYQTMPFGYFGVKVHLPRSVAQAQEGLASPADMSPEAGEEEGAVAGERQPQLSRHHLHPQLKMSAGLSSDLLLRRLSSLRLLEGMFCQCSDLYRACLC